MDALALRAAAGSFPWLEGHLPEALSRLGPGGLSWWQWLALPAAAALAVAAGAVLGRITKAVAASLLGRAGARWDPASLRRLGAPVRLLWTLAAAWAATAWLELPARAEAAAGRGLHAGALVVVFWGLLRGLDVAFDRLGASPWAASQPARATLVPGTRRVAKVAVFALGVIAVLNELGYPVASLLAGVGIGGLAVALAAQKAMEDLVGALAIGVDQPFRVGDYVRVDGFSGTVEAVGLRSTRLRTLDRTLVSIPNGKLAAMTIETFAARDRIRLACTVSLVYGTTAGQMRAALDGIERTLRSHPRIWPDAVQVRFAALAASSLDVEVMAWFRTTDWDEFLAIRQEVLLGFLEVVERAGTSLAFPTRTVHLVGRDSPGP